MGLARGVNYDHSRKRERQNKQQEQLAVNMEGSYICY